MLGMEVQVITSVKPLSAVRTLVLLTSPVSITGVFSEGFSVCKGCAALIAGSLPACRSTRSAFSLDCIVTLFLGHGLILLYARQ